MIIEVKELKVNDIFTECGITSKVRELRKMDFENGKAGILIIAEAIKYNYKMFPRNCKPDGGCGSYHKKETTKISVKR